MRVVQFGGRSHRRLRSAVRGTAGAGGREWDRRPSSAGEEDETAEEEHATGEGEAADERHDVFCVLLSAL